MSVRQKRLNRKLKCHKVSWGRDYIYWDMCVSRYDHLALEALLAVKCFLLTQRALVPRSSARALWNHFNSLHSPLRHHPPPVSPCGSMFHPLRSSESLILLLHSLGLGSRNISHTFIPLFLFYYFPCCLFPTSQDLKEKPTPKEMSPFLFLHLPGPL